MAFHEKKKLKFLRHEKDSYVTKLIYKSLPICSSFFRVLVKEITAVKKKKIMILTFDSEGYCTPIS